jgi:hydrogenase maturation protein HypF
VPPRYLVSLQRPVAQDLPYIDPTGMWHELLDDLQHKVPSSVVAARFHHWLAASLAAMAVYLSLRKNGQEQHLPTVALSGGCFQNRILLEETERQLRQSGFAILTHAQLPPHNGGLCLGQAAVGASQMLDPAR